MSFIIKHRILICTSLFLICCLPSTLADNTNQNRFDDVISYYGNLRDTLKQKAARFLIENMFYHKSVVNPVYDQYYSEIASINNRMQYPVCIDEYAKLYEQLKQPSIDETSLLSDVDAIDPQTLIAHIDAAFEDWKNGLWAQHLSFDDFCEYLLPYRVSSEKYEPWRQELREDYLHYTDNITECDDQRNQPYWAACKVNDALRKLRFHNQKLLPQLRIDWPVSVLRKIRMGECYDYAKLTTYVMRACGIPVSLDFTPQWPDRAHAHHWNALLDNTGYSMPFMGAESNPGYPSKQGRRMAKVYRYTFAYQPQSLYAQNVSVGQTIPPILSNPFVKDVSREYFKGKTVNVKVNGAHPKDTFVYIAVFNNKDWIPVDFARVRNDSTATFSNLGTDIAYMPVYWGRNGSTPAGNVFLLDKNGTIRIMEPDMQRLQEITISRKYPLFERIVKFREMLDYGTFEAANKKDFSDAVTYAKVGKARDTYSGTVRNSINQEYRYWRYKAASNRKCYIAELEFFDKSGKLAPKEILTEGGGLANTKPEYVFDGNKLTYYESRLAKHGWVGADFGFPVRIDHINYIPRNDDNDVVPGQHYELCYYKNGREVVLDAQVAKSGTLKFSQIPANAVYILHNLDKGNEERIFTYENNKIEWY